MSYRDECAVPYIQIQAGRIVDCGNERHQRISRVNRGGRRLLFGVAVTDAPDAGCVPPESDNDRILGFTLQITDQDVEYGNEWVTTAPFYFPGDIVCVSLNDRIKAVAPCDVEPGDQVFVEAHTGVPAEVGITANGCTWESRTMCGELAVIQINTRLRR